MAGTFSAQVSDWIRKSERLTMAVVQQAAQTTVNEMLTPRAKGGRLPVDTGFMRNSASAELGRMPSRDSNASNESQITLTIANLKPGQILYVGFSARYAKYMEYRFGFVRVAAQNWQRNVDAAARELSRRAGR